MDERRYLYVLLVLVIEKEHMADDRLSIGRMRRMMRVRMFG